ncbi:MAG: RNA polymerase sigma-70 factor [Chitinophagaceae bacterium]|nr:RNA polymerase sigma-70 factor [Chitinophagaceae bacterium]
MIPTCQLENNKLHNEKQLLAHIAAGDELAFRELLNAYSDHLGSFVFKVTGSREAAQEIVQDVFMKIWNKRQELPGLSQLNHYLFILTRNLTYNFIRDQSRTSLKFRKWLQEVEAMEEVSRIENEEEHLSRFMPAINLAVSRLPDQQRKVFVMARKQGFSQKQIAQEMGLSAETVKKYMKLALQSIREQVSHLTPPSLILILYLQSNW